MVVPNIAVFSEQTYNYEVFVPVFGLFSERIFIHAGQRVRSEGLRPEAVGYFRGSAPKKQRQVLANLSPCASGGGRSCGEDHGRSHRELLALVDIGTPHIAGYSADGKAAGITAAVRFLARQLCIRELLDWSVAPGSIPASSSPGYDILRDSNALRAALSTNSNSSPVIPGQAGQSLPRLFEHLRETYPIRRESPLPSPDIHPKPAGETMITV